MAEAPGEPTRRNPPWERDELILALDFYLRHRPSFPGQASPEIAELSQVLHRLGQQIRPAGSDTFRNANGVYMKLMNFRGLDPSYSGKGLANMGAGDRAIWEEFGHDPADCARVANAIRSAVATLETSPANAAENDSIDDIEAEEGKAVARVHQRRERSRRIVAEKKAAVLRAHQRLACEGCGLEFRNVYGERGADYIECHHTKPIHTLAPGDKTRLSDLALLCANCHRMVHAQKRWLSLGELRALPGVRRLRALWADFPPDGS